MNPSSDPINTLENLVNRNKSKSISIYLVIMLTIIILLALLPVIQVDISSQSRGLIRSYKDNVPLSTMVGGKIIWQNIKNNQSVTKGDTLLKISKETLETDKKIQDTLSTTTKALLNDVVNILNGKCTMLHTSYIREDYNKYTTKRLELLSKVNQANINFNRNKLLFDKDVISKMEYEKFVFDLQFAKQALTSFDNGQKSTWENLKKELSEKLTTIDGTINKISADSRNYFVLSPITGTIENFSGLQSGSFINPSQSIATISPNDNLIIESNVNPDDIGLIRLKQSVKFQMDAFNYNQWGLLEGEVIEIDKNITINDNQAFFRVKCKLNSKTLALQSGYKIQVKKGMTVTSRFIITRRSLYDLLFDKVDDWLNPKIIKN